MTMSVMSITVFADAIFVNKLDDDTLEWLNENADAFSPTAIFPVIEIPENATDEETQKIIQSALSELDSTYETNNLSEGVTQNTAIFRSGNTTSCELYISWTGTEYVTAFAFDNFKVQSTSLLSPEIYANIGGSYIPCHDPGTSGYAKVLDINIPINISRVRAVVTNPSCCTLDGWLYGAAINSTITIN